MQEATNEKKSAFGRFISALILILLGIVVLFACVLFVTERWLFNTWAALAMDEILYHLSASFQGTNPEMIRDYILHYGIYAAAALVLYIISMILTRKSRSGRVIVICLWIAVSFALVDFVYYDVDRQINLGEYFRELNAPERERTGDFIFDNYTAPNSVEMKFPEQKRNLIFIYLESMETTYTDVKSGGAFSRSIIPELTEIAREYDDFSGDSDQLDGGVALPGSTWTMGAMFAQSTAMPLKLPISGLQVESQIDTDFFPGLTAIGDVLKNEGYHQVLMIGSDAAFGGREAYFETHGEFEIQDYNYAKEQGLIDQDYFVFWGYEDQKLFSFAKDELKKLAKADEPFNLTLLTVDTHFEDGYVCPLCKKEFGANQYANVMACSSRQVAAFIKWVQKQDFYENTTIVLSGDHPTMDKDFCKDVPDSYQRKTYTAVINSAVDPINPDRERLYTTFDLYPTTLAAMGVTIKGNRLGLGTNLYSLRDTILEEYGVETCTAELEKPSAFMDSFSNVSITEETMQKVREDAKLSYRVEDNGQVTFVLNNANALSSGSVKNAVVELENADGETTTVKMVVFQPKTDPNVFWCLGKTNLHEEDLRGMQGEAFLTVEGFEHYSVATWSY